MKKYEASKQANHKSKGNIGENKRMFPQSHNLESQNPSGINNLWKPPHPDISFDQNFLRIWIIKGG